MKNDWKVIFFAAFFLGGIVSLSASSFPDGLERVAEIQGFLVREQRLFATVFPGYTIPGIHDAALGTSFAGIVGVVVIFFLLILIGRYLYIPRADGEGETAHTESLP